MTYANDDIYRYTERMAHKAFVHQDYCEDVVDSTIAAINEDDQYDAAPCEDPNQRTERLPSGRIIETQEIIVGGEVFAVGVIFDEDDDDFPYAAYVGYA